MNYFWLFGSGYGGDFAALAMMGRCLPKVAKTLDELTLIRTTPDIPVFSDPRSPIPCLVTQSNGIELLVNNGILGWASRRIEKTRLIHFPWMEKSNTAYGLLDITSDPLLNQPLEKNRIELSREFYWIDPVNNCSFEWDDKRKVHVNSAKDQALIFDIYRSSISASLYVSERLKDLLDQTCHKMFEFEVVEQ